MTRTTRLVLRVTTVATVATLAAVPALVGTAPSYDVSSYAGPSHSDRPVAGRRAPLTAYELPFPCGEAWTGTTRASHSPSSKAVDWNRPDDLGDQVVAAAAGTVSKLRSTDGSGYGRYVLLDHGNGESTLYAHLQSVAVVVGQTVAQGTPLGAVGDSGNATGPHLHFEERTGTSVVDPWFHGAAFVFATSATSQNCGGVVTPPSNEVPLAANFYGGLSSELVVFERATASTFEVLRDGKPPRVLTLGAVTDQPVLGDWDGDGRANPGVRTPKTKTFQLKVRRTITPIKLGRAADLPIAGDWDGDGRWEIGVRKAGSGVFKLRSASGVLTSVVLGDADDVPVTGDWDGDGRTDLGVYDRTTATFTTRRVDATGAAWTEQVQYGAPGDLPVAGDWDGNGVTDLGVWNPATAVFSKRYAP